MLKIAHRGVHDTYPENTLPAFQKAMETGVDGIELDVRLTSDNELVVIHDETIDRTTNGNGTVNQFTLKELKQFRIDSKYEIPTLVEVIELVATNYLVNIELKEIATVEKVVEVLYDLVQKKHWNYSNFLISSFDWHALKKVHTLNSEIPIGILTATDLELAFIFAKFIKATTLLPHYSLVNEEAIIEIQNAGINIITWTVNENNAIQQMKKLNINGIISDFPDKI